MSKRCKDCQAPVSVSGDILLGDNDTYSCPQCGIRSANEVEETPRRTQKRWEPGCEVDNVGLGDTKLYNVSFRLTSDQYDALRYFMSGNTRDRGLTVQQVAEMFSAAHTKAHHVG